MNHYIILVNLEDPTDMVFAKEQQDPNNTDRYYFPEDTIPTDLPTDDNVFTILPNGRIIKVKDLSVFLQNRSVILQKGFSSLVESLKQEGLSSNDFLQESLKDKQKYASSKEMAIKYKLEYIQTAVKITSVYLLTNDSLDDLINDEQEQENIRNYIKSIREQHEEEKDITNELEMVNKVIQETFPDNTEEITIEECTYNGESISSEDIIDRLSSHVLPEFLTQVNIMDTLDDTYTIKTNLGTIVRESKTGRISIIEN